MILYLLKIKLRHLGEVFRKRQWVKMIVGVSFLVVGAGIMVAVYLMFNRWFAYLESQEYFGTALTFYVLEVFFLIVFLLLLFSSIISAVLFFFKSRETAFLFILPQKVAKIFTYNFILTLASSLWPLVILAFPALISLSINLEVGLAGLILYFASLVLFGIFVCLLGADLVLVAKKFFGNLRRIYKLVLLFLLIGVVLYSAYWTAFPPDLEKFFAIRNLQQLEVSYSQIQHRFRFWLPSHLLVKSFSGYAFRQGWVLSFLSLAGLTLVFGAFALFLEGFYKKGWLKAQEGVFAAGARAPVRRRKKFLSSRPCWFLLEKEARLFARNFNELSRALFLAVLLVFYLLGINYLARFAPASGLGDLRPFLLALNLAILGYFTVTICLRYVFPSLSREGRSADFLFTTPANRMKVFWVKFLFWTGTCEVIMISLGAFTFFAMGFRGAIFGYGILTCFLIVIFSTFLAHLLGTYFADFAMESADQYTTTPAGLVFTITGFLYVFGVSFSFYRLAKVFFEQHYIDALNITLFLGGTLACLSLISALVPRALKRLQT